jgi:hypothetical protein
MLRYRSLNVPWRLGAKPRMSFFPRRIFNIEVAAIAVIVFSVALICYVLLSLAGIITMEFPY